MAGIRAHWLATSPPGAAVPMIVSELEAAVDDGLRYGTRVVTRVMMGPRGTSYLRPRSYRRDARRRAAPPRFRPPTSSRFTVWPKGERSYRRAIYRQDLAGNAGNRARPPPRAAKLRPRAQLGHVHALITGSSARRPLRSATLLAVRHWLGFASRNTAEGADTATSGGALLWRNALARVHELVLFARRAHQKVPAGFRDEPSGAITALPLHASALKNHTCRVHGASLIPCLRARLLPGGDGPVRQW